MLLFVVLGRFGVFGLEVLGAGRVFLLVFEGAMAGRWDWIRWSGRSGMMRNGGVRGEGGQSVGLAGWLRCSSSDECTLIEKTAEPNQEHTKSGTGDLPLVRHKEWAAQKVVTTLEADAKSSDQLLTRSHEGGTRSTAGERLLSSSSTGSSLLGDISLIGPQIVFSCASEHSVTR